MLHKKAGFIACFFLWSMLSPAPVRIAYISDYQSDAQKSLVQMYQGEMYKKLWVKMLGKTEENSYLFSDFSEKSLSLRRKHLISY